MGRRAKRKIGLPRRRVTIPFYVPGRDGYHGADVTPDEVAPPPADWLKEIAACRRELKESAAAAVRAEIADMSEVSLLRTVRRRLELRAPRSGVPWHISDAIQFIDQAINRLLDAELRNAEHGDGERIWP